MGWGLDAHWAALAREHGWRMGVVDATPIGHTLRPPAATYAARRGARRGAAHSSRIAPTCAATRSARSRCTGEGRRRRGVLPARRRPGARRLGAPPGAAPRATPAPTCACRRPASHRAAGRDAAPASCCRRPCAWPASRAAPCSTAFRCSTCATSRPAKRRSYGSWGAWAAPALAARAAAPAPRVPVRARARPQRRARRPTRCCAPRIDAPLVVSEHGADVLHTALRHDDGRRAIERAFARGAPRAGQQRRDRAGRPSARRPAHARRAPGHRPAARARGRTSASRTLVTVAHLVARKRHVDVIRALWAAARAPSAPALPDHRRRSGARAARAPRRRARPRRPGDVRRPAAARRRPSRRRARARSSSCRASTRPSASPTSRRWPAGCPRSARCGEPGPAEIARPGDGLRLVPPGDVSQLAGAIDVLLSEPTFLRELGRRARADGRALVHLGGLRARDGRRLRGGAARVSGPAPGPVRHQPRAARPRRRLPGAARAQGIELALFGGRLHHATAGVEDPGVPFRRIRQREAHALAASGRHRAVIASSAGRVAVPATYCGARRAGIPFVYWTGIWGQIRTPAHLAAIPLTRAVDRRADAVVDLRPARQRLRGRARRAQRPRRAAGGRQRLLGRRGRCGAGARGGRRSAVPGAVRGACDARRQGPRRPARGLEAAGLTAPGGRARARRRRAGRGRERSRRRRGRPPRGPRTAQLLRRRRRSRRTVDPHARLPRAVGARRQRGHEPGTPIIATDAVGAAAGGLVRDGRTGLVVPAGDARRAGGARSGGCATTRACARGWPPQGARRRREVRLFGLGAGILAGAGKRLGGPGSLLACRACRRLCCAAWCCPRRCCSPCSSPRSHTPATRNSSRTRAVTRRSTGRTARRTTATRSRTCRRTRSSTPTAATSCSRPSARLRPPRAVAVAGGGGGGSGSSSSFVPAAGGDPLATATPAERAAVTQAVQQSAKQSKAPGDRRRQGAEPQSLGAGRPVSASISDLPTSLLIAARRAVRRRPRSRSPCSSSRVSAPVASPDLPAVFAPAPAGRRTAACTRPPRCRARC